MPRATLIVLVLGASALTGCGSGGASSSGVNRARPGAGFLSQVNAACRADTAAIRRAPKTVAALAAAERKFIQKLRTLNPPGPLRAIFHQYVSALEQNLAAFERHDVAASRQSKAKLQPLLGGLRSAGATSC